MDRRWQGLKLVEYHFIFEWPKGPVKEYLFVMLYWLSFSFIYDTANTVYILWYFYHVQRVHNLSCITYLSKVREEHSIIYLFIYYKTGKLKLNWSLIETEHFIFWPVTSLVRLWPKLQSKRQKSANQANSQMYKKLTTFYLIGYLL